MGMIAELIGYAATGMELLVALVVLVLGVAVVRPVSAAAGYAVAAAGGVRLLFTCCIDGGFAVSNRLAPDLGEGLTWLATLVGPIQHAVFWGLVAFAAFTVAQDKARAVAPGQGS